MKGNVFADGEVRKLIEDSFVFAELYTDRATAEDRANRDLWKTRFGVVLPLYVTLDSKGRELSRLEGLSSKQAVVDFLRRGLAEYGANN